MSRNEDILNSILHGEKYEKEPQSRIEKLLIELGNLIQSGGGTSEQIETAVLNYLEQHPVQPGATEDQAKQIQENAQNIKNAFMIKGSIAEKTNLSDLQTGMYVINGTSNADFPVSGQVYGTLIQGEGLYKPQFIIGGITGASNLYTRRFLTGAQKYTPWTSMPTLVSQLVNDSGYITNGSITPVIGVMGRIADDLYDKEPLDYLSKVDNYGFSVTGVGTQVVGSVQYRYQVNAGDLIHILAPNTVSPTTYVFKASNSAVSTNNVGDCVGGNVNRYVVVPDDASWLFVGCDSNTTVTVSKAQLSVTKTMARTVGG